MPVPLGNGVIHQLHPSRSVKIAVNDLRNPLPQSLPALQFPAPSPSYLHLPNQINKTLIVGADYEINYVSLGTELEQNKI